MGRTKKLAVQRFDSIKEVENYYNSFEKEIISYDIKVISVINSKPNFLISLEYFDD